MRLRDDRVEVEIDDVTGGVVAVRDHELGDVLRDDAGGSLFVLEMPRAGDRTVVVETAGQRLSRAARSDNGVVLEWDEPVTSAGERLAGHVVVRLRLHAGRLELALEHHLVDVRVEAVRFPSLRGITGPDDTLEWRGVDYSTGTRVPLLPVFENNSPYWGTIFPDYASGNLRPEVMGNPTSPFLLLAGTSGGLAVLPQEPTLEFIGWRASLEPGYQDSLRRIAGDACVTLDAIHFPVDGAAPRPMTLAVYRGPWLAGTDVYRATQGPARRGGAAWLDEPRSWLQVQTMSTEGEPRYDFATLEQIVEECARAGVGAVQVTGWNEGGQDGLVPVHRPAEKLGGEAGLRRVLDRARALDVKIVLYVKYQWVERPGPSWAELARYACVDANGQTYAQPGPVYHSARKRYGISTPSYVPLCFAAPELRARFAEEVGRMAAWGADGVLADESLYHGRALLCFATDHGHEPGESAFLWDADFVEDLRRAALEHGGEFVVVGEGCYDAQFGWYDASYFRSFSASHVPLGRLLRPEAPILTALTGFDDRGMVNQALLFGYGLSFEPYHFKGRPGDMPETVAYGVAMDRVRARLAPWLWRGELVAAPEVTVADAATGRPYDRFTVWRAAGQEGTCLVVDNLGDDAVDVVVRGMDMVSGIRADAAPADVSGGRVHVPARTALVVLDGATTAWIGSRTSSSLLAGG